MKKILLLVFLLLQNANIFAQEKFEIEDASKNYTVKLVVARCDNGFCKGAATFSLFKKGEKKPFQILKTSDTSIWLNKNGQAQANITLLYDEQSTINFGDFNFDGAEDLAICDGTNGGYGAPSYQVYLFSPRRQRFVLNPSLSRLAQGEYLGMFQINGKKKTLQAFSKSGCCWHQTQEFRVIANRPQKILEITEDATGVNNKVKIISKRIVNGRWKTSVKYKNLSEQDSK